MNMVHKIFTTCDNSRLMCAVWDNVEKPVGVVQIIHGLFDNMSTYDKLATFLNRNRYIVFGIDASLDKTTGDFEHSVAQEIDISRYLITKYALPIFLIGYGYGGFVAQSVLRHTASEISGACLIKSSMYNRWVIRIARTFAQIGAKIRGTNTQTHIMNFFKRQHCGHTQKYPMCTYGFCKSLFDGLMSLNNNDKSNNPILIISDATEHEAATSQFSRALYKAYNSNDLINTTLLIYPEMRNTLLLEMNCGRIQNDILSFLNDNYSHISANLNGTILDNSEIAN